jgi:hypothetical protein
MPALKRAKADPCCKLQLSLATGQKVSPGIGSNSGQRGPRRGSARAEKVFFHLPRLGVGALNLHPRDLILQPAAVGARRFIDFAALTTRPSRWLSLLQLHRAIRRYRDLAQGRVGTSADRPTERATRKAIALP